MKRAGTLAGVGLIFTYLLGLIPIVGGILCFIGIILFLMGVYRISKIKNAGEVFKSFLTPLIINFIAALLMSLGWLGLGDDPDALLGFSLIVIAPLMMVASIFYMKAYRPLANVTGVSLFNTAATFYKWGAILMLVFGVGAIAMIFGSLIAIAGFFSIEEKEASDTKFH